MNLGSSRFSSGVPFYSWPRDALLLESEWVNYYVISSLELRVKVCVCYLDWSPPYMIFRSRIDSECCEDVSEVLLIDFRSILCTSLPTVLCRSIALCYDASWSLLFLTARFKLLSMCLNLCIGLTALDTVVNCFIPGYIYLFLQATFPVGYFWI